MSFASMAVFLMSPSQVVASIVSIWIGYQRALTISVKTVDSIPLSMLTPISGKGSNGAAVAYVHIRHRKNLASILIILMCWSPSSSDFCYAVDDLCNAGALLSVSAPDLTKL